MFPSTESGTELLPQPVYVVVDALPVLVAYNVVESVELPAGVKVTESDVQRVVAMIGKQLGDGVGPEPFDG